MLSTGGDAQLGVHIQRDLKLLSACSTNLHASALQTSYTILQTSYTVLICDLICH